MTTVTGSIDSAVDSVETTTTHDHVVDGFTELLDDVDSEAIANEYEIGRHSKRIDFAEHAKIGAFLGITDPKTLDDLAQQTDVREGLKRISHGHFSRLTTRRHWRAFAELANAILERPQFYQPFGALRKRLEQVVDRWVGGFDATKLPIHTTMLVEIDGELHELRPEHGGLQLHLAARLDPASTHPIGEVITGPNMHETRCFDDLLEKVEAHESLDEIIAAFDKGYVDYDRFCELKHQYIDFVTPLKDDAWCVVEETLCDLEFDATEDKDVTRLTDEWIELGATEEQFRRVTVSDSDGDEGDDEKVHRYLMTLPPATYDPLDVALIYAVRWLIEILFRELKQYFIFRIFIVKH